MKKPFAVFVVLEDMHEEEKMGRSLFFRRFLPHLWNIKQPQNVLPRQD